MLRRLAVVLATSGACATRALAATPGFVEDFASGTAGFGGGSTVTHVTSGGVGGAGDPYIEISEVVSSQLGAFSQAANLVGNLPADGVTGYSFWLRDTGANDNHQIHVGVGTTANFWLSIPGFVPPDGSWQRFSVDLGDASQWVRIIGSGTFQSALATADRLLFRHDLPPLTQVPNNTTGGFGLDRIAVLPVSAPSLGAAAAAVLGALLLGAGALGIARPGSRAPRGSAGG